MRRQLHVEVPRRSPVRAGSRAHRRRDDRSELLASSFVLVVALIGAGCRPRIPGLAMPLAAATSLGPACARPWAGRFLVVPGRTDATGLYVRDREGALVLVGRAAAGLAVAVDPSACGPEVAVTIDGPIRTRALLRADVLGGRVTTSLALPIASGRAELHLDEGQLVALREPPIGDALAARVLVPLERWTDEASALGPVLTLTPAGELRFDLRVPADVLRVAEGGEADERRRFATAVLRAGAALFAVTGDRVTPLEEATARLPRSAVNVEVLGERSGPFVRVRIGAGPALVAWVRAEDVEEIGVVGGLVGRLEPSLPRALAADDGGELARVAPGTVVRLMGVPLATVTERAYARVYARSAAGAARVRVAVDDRLAMEGEVPLASLSRPD